MEQNEDWKSWVCGRGLPPRVVKLLESQEVNSFGDLKRLDPVDWVQLIGITGVISDAERCQLMEVLDELQQSPHPEDLIAARPQSLEACGKAADPCCSSDSEDCSHSRAPLKSFDSSVCVIETECHNAQSEGGAPSPPPYGFRQLCPRPCHEDDWKSWLCARGLPLRVVRLLESQDVNSLRDLVSRDPVDVVELIGITGDLCDIERRQLKGVLGELHQSHGGDFEQCRLLLLGKTGNGKSTTGNTILGKDEFDSSGAFTSCTSDCQRATGWRGNTKIEILDVPGLFDTEVSQEKICTLIAQAVFCMHPGPDAILFVLQISRFTEEEYEAYQRVKTLFNENVCRYIILLFTRGNNLGSLRGAEASDKVARMIADDGPDTLREVFWECGERAVVFENQVSDEQDKTLQVEYLMQVVSKLKASNRNIPYSCPKFQEIGRSIEEVVSERMQKVEREEAEKMRRLEKEKEELERKLRTAGNMARSSETAAFRPDPLAESSRRWREDELFRHNLRMIELDKMKQAFIENKEKTLIDKVMSLVKDVVGSAVKLIKPKCTVS